MIGSEIASFCARDHQKEVLEISTCRQKKEKKKLVVRGRIGDVMKVSKQLADVLEQASREVGAWPQWQRSLDPQGSQNENLNGQADSSAGSVKAVSNQEESK